jgi:hypothetical protein
VIVHINSLGNMEDSVFCRISSAARTTSVSLQGYGDKHHALDARHEYVSHMHGQRKLLFRDGFASLDFASVACFITRGILLFSRSCMRTLHVR